MSAGRVTFTENGIQILSDELERAKTSLVLGGFSQEIQIVREESIRYGAACASKWVILRKLPGR